ncbi:MAG TPA: aminoglycoside phosphotransferase family protein [Longimicrobiales bacterium]
MLPILIPRRLERFCRGNPERSAWLQKLPGVVSELASRWTLTLANAFEHGHASCSWVAPAVRADGAPVVLKIGVPHMEAEQEIDALRLLHGDPTVYLLEADRALNALLLERCEPGTALRVEAIASQDQVIAELVRRISVVPVHGHPFRHLSAMVASWGEETRRDRRRWPDAALVQDGLAAFEELASPASGDVLLATDLHAGNVLRAQRRPWLVIDPKPFIGDAAYDGTQHLLNTRDRLEADPDTAIRMFADMLAVDSRRLRLWLFARLAAEPRDLWDEGAMVLARRLRA